jgi:phenylpyruvate tautomerase PptA (4-oxalocrotonate tautomerase family)
MPFLNIVTNSQIDDESALIKAASQTVSKASGKPETYVMVTVQSQNMSMSGEQAPAAFLDYRALGLPNDRTAFSDALCTMINDQLGIDGDRIYISMTDSERQNWGWNHGTF